MNTIIEIILATLFLWVFFIFVATLKNKLFDKNHPLLIRVPFYIVGIIFIIIDVIYNFTYGALLFKELASMERKTFTARLKHTLHSGDYPHDKWRFKLARFMCRYMIEPWDWNHCALSKL